MKTVFVIYIPWVPEQFATKWHPTFADGPFKVLCRGQFDTYDSAIIWGRSNLEGTPYEVRSEDLDR